MDWEEAMEEARDNLGYSQGEYVEDFSGLVEEAKDIQYNSKEEEYEDFCANAKFEYKEYLKSDKWKKLREKVMKRDNFTCKDCGNTATEVHHKRYVNMGTPWELYELVSLCNNCYKKRHNINEEK